MARNLPSRLPMLATILFAVAALAAITLLSAGTNAANAQDQPPAGNPIQTPPPVPGIDPITGVAGTDSSVAAATPAAPADAASAPTPGAPIQGGTVTASLGGSDVAVSSVGGSYEVDGPKRRAKRANRD